jgi:hypothetical protein
MNSGLGCGLRAVRVDSCVVSCENKGTRARSRVATTGWSLGQGPRIAAGVSKSSVSLWVRDIELTEAQLHALRERNPAYNAQRNGAATLVARGRVRRAAYQEEGRALVRQGHERFAHACLLYWAEGSKSRHSLSFSNADAAMVLLWMDLLRTTLRVPEDRFRITCYLFADHAARQREVEEYWLELTRLRQSNMCRSIVNNYSRSSKRKGTQQAAVRNSEGSRPRHSLDSDGSRRNPRDRRFRPARLAGIEARAR